MKLPIKVPNTFRIIAHRGASAYAPENTISAFELAFQMGVNEIELDTQLSSDGKVIICHDATLKKYGHGEKIIENMTWEELEVLDIGSWFSPFLFSNEKIPSLENLFTRFDTVFTYHVEIKGVADSLPTAVCNKIKDFQLEDHCIVTSFSYDVLRMVRTESPTIRLGWLVEQLTESILDKAQELDLYQICLKASKVTQINVLQARQVVSEVRAWGVNGTHEDMINLILNILSSGCDGMTINNPDWITH